MTKEFKNYELCSTKKPAKSELLSTTAAVVRDDQTFYCYISFSQKLIDKVGKVLPFGLSKENPGYIIVEHLGRLGYWDVSAVYHTGLYRRMLWQTPIQPSWISFYKIKVSA